MFIKIVLSKIWHKRLSSFLCILLMAIGVAIISLISNLSRELEKNFSENISGIDMVVGAKGSPLQLILSSVFHLDAPTGNISLEEVNSLVKNNPQVKTFIPLSYGDNYAGYRIVGSTEDLLKQYKAEILQGKEYTKPMEVVIGNKVAKNLGLKLEDLFTSSHGLDKDGEHHDEEEYKVVGILKPNGSVLDKLIICNLESIWDIHHHEGEEETEEHHEITAALVNFKSPMGMMTMPRLINENSTMQAALPAIEINRLLTLFDDGIKILGYLAYLIVIVAGISVFISLYNSLKDERGEKALMITLGASRFKVFSLLLAEGIMLSIIGYLVGIVISRLALFIIQRLLSTAYLADFNFTGLSKSEIYLFLLALLIGLLSAALPSLGIFKINLSKTMAEN